MEHPPVQSASHSGFQPGEYLTFRLARQMFAIERRWVCAILPVHQLQPLVGRDSGTPAWWIGEAQTGGQPFPIVDLAARLGLPKGTPETPDGRDPYILAIDTSGGDGSPILCGFVADRVTELIKVRSRDFRQGRIRIGRPRRVLHPEQVLPLEELEAILG